MDDVVCDACGHTISLEDYVNRHTDEFSEYHYECCPVCTDGVMEEPDYDEEKWDGLLRR